MFFEEVLVARYIVLEPIIFDLKTTQPAMLKLMPTQILFGDEARARESTTSKPVFRAAL